MSGTGIRLLSTPLRTGQAVQLPFEQPTSSPMSRPQYSAPSAVETTLRRDLATANRAIADLWMRTGGGLGDFEEGTLSRSAAHLLEDEVAMRMNAAAEMRGDMLEMLKFALTRSIAQSAAIRELDECFDTAVAATVSRVETVKSLTRRAQLAEARAAELETRLMQQQELTRVLSEELRDVRCNKAMQEIMTSTNTERWRIELEELRRQLPTGFT